MLKGLQQIRILHNECDWILPLKKTKPDRRRLVYEQQNQWISVSSGFAVSASYPQSQCLTCLLCYHCWAEACSRSFPADHGCMDSTPSELWPHVGVRMLAYLCLPFTQLQIFGETVKSVLSQGLRGMCSARSGWGTGAGWAWRGEGVRAAGGLPGPTRMSSRSWSPALCSGSWWDGRSQQV